MNSNLKQIATILLLLAFLIQVLNRSVIIIDYYINTAAYALNCENKSRPEKQCQGKCQMMKKVEAEAKKDQQDPERLALNKNEVSSSKSFFPQVISPESSPFTFAKAGNHQSYPKGTHTLIFHPPA